jgi:hypothetical protein
MSTQTGALPAGCVLVHIGPYKTGSTALQHSLAAHRDELEQHGVWYPGPDYRQMRPSWAVTGRALRGVEPVPVSEWEDFAGSVRTRTRDVVCVSSEDFVLATEEQAGRVVHDLGDERVHVLLVARRLDRLLPSAWQERVKSANETLSFDDFVTVALDPERSHPSSRSFWSNHELAAILGRWLPSLPAERLHVLVADESDRGRLNRQVERLLGLRQGLLAPAGSPNTSLSFERVELVRRLNEVFDERGWSDRDRLTLIHRGLLRMVEPVPLGSGETAIPQVPSEARTRLAELDQHRIDSLRVPGLDVIGDPELLRSGVHTEEYVSSSRTLDVEVVVRAVEGVVAARLKKRHLRAVRTADAEASGDAAEVPTSELARELVRRVGRRVRPRRSP